MQEKEQKISPIKQRILQFADSLGISKRVWWVLTGRGVSERVLTIAERVIAERKQ